MFLNTNFAILSAALSAAAALGLEELSVGALREGKLRQGVITASADNVEVIGERTRTGNRALRLLGGKEKSLTYSFIKTIEQAADFEFWMQPWSSKSLGRVKALVE